jgi:hypothetical protein
MKKQTIASKVSLLIKGTRGSVRTSLIELFTTGETTTGTSGYSGGYARKSVWTAETVRQAQAIGLTVESGNNAPRGGASGEYVRLVADRRKNRLAWQCIYACERLEMFRFIRNSRKQLAQQIRSERNHETTISDFERLKTEIETELRKKYPELQLSHKQANSAAWHIGNKMMDGKFNNTTLRSLIKNF